MKNINKSWMLPGLTCKLKLLLIEPHNYNYEVGIITTGYKAENIGSAGLYLNGGVSANNVARMGYSANTLDFANTNIIVVKSNRIIKFILDTNPVKQNQVIAVKYRRLGTNS